MDFILSLFKDKDSKDETQRLSLQEELSKSFPAENIRVYKDGGRLLYDSLSPPDRTPQGANPSVPKKPSIPKNQDLYGDLMLGAVPLAQDGMTTKIHHQQDSNVLMFSKMFCIITRRKVASPHMEDDDEPEERRRSADRVKSMPVTSSTTTTPPRPTSVSASAYSVKPQRTTITSSSFSHGSQQMRMAMRTPGPPDRRSSTNFNQIGELQQAIAAFQHSIQSLFSAPRLEYPIWSAVSSATKGRVTAYTLFLNSLKSLDVWDAGSGFLPTLITGLLSTNLSWIRFLDLSDFYIPEEAKKFLNKDRSATSSHQNPMLWQLEDLFGFFGTKQNISRTIVLTEKGTPHLNECLLILSYFLRCTQVCYPPTPDSPGKLYPPPPPLSLSENSDNISSPSSAIPSSPISIPSISSAIASSTSPPPPASSSSMTSASQPSSAASSHQKPNGHPHLHERGERERGEKGDRDKEKGEREVSGTGNVNLNINDPMASWYTTTAGAGFAESSLPFSQNFSFSLYAGMYPGYLSDMALSASNLTRDAVIPYVLADMHTWMDHAPFSTKVQSASCIIANLSSRKCEVLTYCPSPSITPPDELVQTLDSAWFSSVPKTVNREVTTDSIERSEYITATLASVRELWALGIPPEACVMYLEDRLRNVYIRSLSLLKHLQMLPCPSRLTFGEAADLVGCGTVSSDVHLFVAILEGVLPSSSFNITTLKEIGNWWLLVEPKPTPEPTSGNDSSSAIHL